MEQPRPKAHLRGHPTGPLLLKADRTAQTAKALADPLYPLLTIQLMAPGPPHLQRTVLMAETAPIITLDCPLHHQ